MCHDEDEDDDRGEEEDGDGTNQRKEKMIRFSFLAAFSQRNMISLSLSFLLPFVTKSSKSKREGKETGRKRAPKTEVQLLLPAAPAAAAVVE